MTIMVTTAHPPIPQNPTQERVLLQDITWTTFEALIRELAAQPSKRLTYDGGLLEIWMPLPPHESFKRWLGRMVEIMTEEMDCEVRSLSSSTWRRPDLAKGVEADECYYIQNEALVRGRMDIDLTVDPPPDLAIEIDMTSVSLPRLPIYQALAVPEVWRFDGERLVFLQWVEGEYAEIDQSIALPLATVTELMPLLQQAQEMGETSWARSVRRWIREKLDRQNNA
jgi:Uma2 family endonuclease